MHLWVNKYDRYSVYAVIGRFPILEKKMEMREISLGEQEQVTGGNAAKLLFEVAFGYFVGKVIDGIAAGSSAPNGNISDHPAA
ncbi:MAG: hypothetical protein U1E77_19810 [Inhella sp.]